MANKNRKSYGFFATKVCFFLRKYFDVPHAIGVFGRTFVEPIIPELSQRGRLLGAVAQWQLRLCFHFIMWVIIIVIFGCKNFLFFGIVVFENVVTK